MTGTDTAVGRCTRTHTHAQWEMRGKRERQEKHVIKTGEHRTLGDEERWRLMLTNRMDRGGGLLPVIATGEKSQQKIRATNTNNETGDRRLQPSGFRKRRSNRPYTKFCSDKCDVKLITQTKQLTFVNLFRFKCCCRSFITASQ